MAAPPMLQTSQYGYNPYTKTIFKSSPGTNGLALTPNTPVDPLMFTGNFGVDPVAKTGYTSQPGNQALVVVGTAGSAP